MTESPRRSGRSTKGVAPKRFRNGDEVPWPSPRKRTRYEGDLGDADRRIALPTNMEDDLNNAMMNAVLDGNGSVSNDDLPPLPDSPPPLHHIVHLSDNNTDQMHQILALKQRVIALQREVEASKGARNDMETQRAAIDRELLALRQQPSMNASTHGTASSTSSAAQTSTTVSRSRDNDAAQTLTSQQMTTNAGASTSRGWASTPTWLVSTHPPALQASNSVFVASNTAAMTMSAGPPVMPTVMSAVQQAPPRTGLFTSLASDCAPTWLVSSQPRSCQAPTSSMHATSVHGYAPPTSAGPWMNASVIHQGLFTSGMSTAASYAANVVTSAHSTSTTGTPWNRNSNTYGYPAPVYKDEVQHQQTVGSAQAQQQFTANMTAGGAQTAPNAHVFIVQRDAAGHEYAQLMPVVSDPKVVQSTFSVQCDSDQHSASAQFEPNNAMWRSNPPSSTGRIYERRRLHDLPIFSGKPEEWPLFVHSFHATTESYGYTELENLLRLQKCLTGEARASVASMLILPRNIGQVIASLEMRFGHPSLLVRSQIQIAKRLPVVDEAHIEELVPFATNVQNLAAFLDTDATQHHLHNTELLDELLSKLPMARRIDWASVAMRIEPHPTIKDFALWLSEMARLINIVAPAATSKVARSNAAKPTQKSKHVYMVNTSDDSVPECAFCDAVHDVKRCDKFIRLSIKDRWREVRRLQLCFVCLRHGHMIPSCDRKRPCGSNGCLLFHNEMLHEVKNDESNPADCNRGPSNPERAEDRQPAASTKSGARDRARRRQSTGRQSIGDGQVETAPAAVNVVKFRERKNENTLLFRVVPVVLHGRDRTIETHALFDEGSSITLIDADLADSLQLDGPTSELDVQWFSARRSVESSRKVAVGISGHQRDGRRYELSCVRTIKNLTLPIQTIDKKDLCRSSPHLRGVPIAEYEHARPKILIGLDHHHLGIPMEVRTNAKRDGLVAAKTALGWVVYGSSGESRPRTPVVMHIGSEDVRYEELNELVKAYFSTDDFGVKLPVNAIESDEAIRSRRILENTTRRVGRRFETGLLWKDDVINMPDNYDTAVRRLRTVESKMNRDPKYAEQYKAQIESYVAQGYARKMTEAEANRRSNRTWFLPHFAVMNVNKPGKFRLVFDAAAKTHGVSLNTKLMSGPDINVPLSRLLLQFRLGVIGVTADIKEMYLQIRIREADRDAQRFLWRSGDNSAKPDVYVMDVMTFGSTCSPASAQHVKNVNATEHEEEFPEAADAIRRKHYVDDFVSSFDTIENAIRISAGVVEVHKRGGFELRGFASNSQEVIRGLNSDTGPGGPMCMQLDKNETEKVLGMCWDTADDTFMFQTRFNRVRPELMTGERTPTKREILSVSMSVFDPYGFLAHFMLESKIILQDLWRASIDWDETIPASMQKRWQDWRAEIDRTRLLRVPRCFSPYLRTSSDVQLHLFADASELAFAAVAYLRVAHADGVELSFVLGKTRCAPLKILTVPRLELQAAVLASRMEHEIRQSLDIQISRTCFWSDSETVLKWLRSDQRKYKPFVAFRVAEILEVSTVSSWRWVPTSMNPADDATRVQRPPKYDPDARWTRGPEWLRSREEEWPVREPTDIGATVDGDDDEVRKKFVGAVNSVSVQTIDFQRFSQFRRLCRAVAWILRISANARLKAAQAQRKRGELGAEEIDLAMLSLCRLVQRDVYADEYKRLKDGRQLTASSAIYTLKPYVDDAGLMRVYGRTDAADDDVLPFDARRPILLPRQHRFTMLLVREQHEKMAHQLTNATIAAIRARFWVPQVRVLVRSVQSNCLACRKRTVQPLAPVQGQLPLDRLTPYVRPFTSTGLDFFGPVMVTVGRRREKRWVALFTCLATRAVHLEVAADLSADACMVCVRNLCHLRGTPTRIRCDNGTNFVGASNELANEASFFDTETMQREMSSRGIEWSFNCPGNPEAGGIWERLVQSIKRVLKVTLKEEAPRIETLRAHLLEAANMVNSRPLTHLPVAPGEDAALTPNHFLIGGPNAVTMAGPTEAEPSHVKKQWRICRELSRRFWAQWLREYLPELTRRSKNYPERTELKPDDLVVVCDGQQPRGQWPMGRIVSVAVGQDGRVRTAEVKTANGFYRRPVSKLAAFEVESG